MKMESAVSPSEIKKTSGARTPDVDRVICPAIFLINCIKIIFRLACEREHLRKLALVDQKVPVSFGLRKSLATVGQLLLDLFRNV